MFTANQCKLSNPLASPLSFRWEVRCANFHVFWRRQKNSEKSPPVEEKLKTCSVTRALARRKLAPGSSAYPSSGDIPPVLDSLQLYWTLVDQSIIPPGFEDVFVSFSEEWAEAA